MAICVSRRNRRKTASESKPLKRDYILLFVSLAVFFGALTCFAWAVPSRSSPANQDSSISSNESSSTQESAYTGKIASGQNQSASSSSSSSASSSVASNTASSRSSSAIPEPAIPPEESPASSVAETGSIQHGGAASEGESEYVEYYEQEGAQSYHVVHHTAYQEYPVYTTVHHQASTPREVAINGTARIEWTSCPVCGQQHSNSYNERIVDHVNEVYCAACGGQHSSSYDEVVYE